jgi:hypothetical protein
MVAFYFVSCNKKENSEVTGYVENNTPYKIYVDFYEPYEGDDILTSHMTMRKHQSIDPGQKVFVGNLGLKTDVYYIYDWYSEDYLHTNWIHRHNDSYWFLQTFCNNDTKLHIKIKEEKASNERMICLSGNGNSTRWQTVDAYDLQGNRIWDDLSSKKHHFLNIMYYTAIIDSNWEYQRYCIPQGIRAGYDLVDTNRFWLITDYLDPVPDIILTDNADFISPRLTTGSTDTLFYLTYTYVGGTKKFMQPVYKIAKVETRH